MTEIQLSPAVAADKIYEQRCAEFRSLNGFFWQIPLIVMSLNGGLWFAVASLDVTPIAKSAVLIFAGVADLGMIAVLIRLRVLMDGLLTQILAMEGGIARKGGWIVLTVFCVLFAFAGLGAFAAAGRPAYFFQTKGSGSVLATTSHVVTAMFGDTPRARGAFRISPGRFTSEVEMAQAGDWIIAEAGRLRAGAFGGPA